MIWSHLRSNAIAYLALFLALGGGVAWAVERNSVKSKHIANRTIKPVDVKPNSLTGKQVKNKSLTAADIKTATLATTRSAAGIVNPDGTVQDITSGVTADRESSGSYRIDIPYSVIPNSTRAPVPVFQIIAADDHHVEGQEVIEGSSGWQITVDFSGGDHLFGFIVIAP